MCSDGWDDVLKNHLINFITTTGNAAFFEGTHKLTADEHEDAVSVARLMVAAMQRSGELNFVQVRATPFTPSLTSHPPSSSSLLLLSPATHPRYACVRYPLNPLAYSTPRAPPPTGGH